MISVVLRLPPRGHPVEHHLLPLCHEGIGGKQLCENGEFELAEGGLPDGRAEVREKDATAVLLRSVASERGGLAELGAAVEGVDADEGLQKSLRAPEELWRRGGGGEGGEEEGGRREGGAREERGEGGASGEWGHGEGGYRRSAKRSLAGKGKERKCKEGEAAEVTEWDARRSGMGLGGQAEGCVALAFGGECTLPAGCRRNLRGAERSEHSRV